MKKLFVVSFPIMLLVLAFSLWVAVNEPVRAVRVEGPLTLAEQSAIREVVTRTLDRPLLNLELDRVVDAIRELSWPRAVSVRRVWPVTLEIRVEKETVVARWGADAYLTSAGKVVNTPQGDATLPLLEVHLSEPKVAMELFHRLQNALIGRGLGLTALVEDRAGQWRITLHNGLDVMLGSDRLLERLQRFTRVYADALALEVPRIAGIDARYANGIAVRWRENTEDGTTANVLSDPVAMAGPVAKGN